MIYQLKRDAKGHYTLDIDTLTAGIIQSLIAVSRPHGQATCANLTVRVYCQSVAPSAPAHEPIPGSEPGDEKL